MIEIISSAPDEAQDQTNAAACRLTAAARIFAQAALRAVTATAAAAAAASVNAAAREGKPKRLSPDATVEDALTTRRSRA